MKQLLIKGDHTYYKLEKPDEINIFKIKTFEFFKGLGIVDYEKTFKAWLRKFPRPIFLAAIKDYEIIGWVLIDEWTEGVAKDGNAVYVLRAIETQPHQRKKKIGYNLVNLGLIQTAGYMITKPMGPLSRKFFDRFGFVDTQEFKSCPVDLSKHPGYMVLPLEKKRDILKDTKDTFVIIDEKQVTLGLIYTPLHIAHKSNLISPENPERLERIMRYLQNKMKQFSESNCKLIQEFEPATEEDILRVHTKKYVEFIMNYCKKGGGFLGDSTYFTYQTFALASLAAGGAIKAGECVVNKEFDYAFALIRPPGHHATMDKYGGYCIFNNSAILARYLQEKKGLKKIMIIDWDAHAANGTCQIFYDDPSVFVISLHQDPHGFYPHEGFMAQIGKGEGLGYTVNIEMPKESGDTEYILAFDELVLPLYKSYAPDFVIGCNGFDSHHSDPYTDLQLTSDGYYRMVQRLRNLAKNKLVLLLEGGYHPNLGPLTHTIIKSLLGEENPFIEHIDVLSSSASRGDAVYKLTSRKISNLKTILKDFHKI